MTKLKMLARNLYFKAENLVLRARSESVGFAEIVNKDRMVGTKAFMPFRVQRHRGTKFLTTITTLRYFRML